MEIFPSSKIYIKESKIHGYGVFAKTDIKKGEEIEVCPFLSFPQTNKEKIPVFQNHTFCFPRSENWSEHALVLGYGSYFNHSEKPNADWYTKNEERVFVYYSLEDIEEGQEILINYANGSFFTN